MGSLAGSPVVRLWGRRAQWAGDSPPRPRSSAPQCAGPTGDRASIAMAAGIALHPQPSGLQPPPCCAWL
eukprot:8221061-Alexandrium_andersonii.AAC.1